MSFDASGDASGSSDFAHLHLHTQYSLLDGAIRVKDLCKAVHAKGMKSVAVTDHGNMFGAIQFYKEAKAVGIKPIFGSEVYVAEKQHDDRTERKAHHLILLAKNEVGYRNLQRLVSFGHLRGFYYVPRIDLDLLRDHSEGLIGLSACLAGNLPRLVLAGAMDQAKDRLLHYRSIFAQGDFYAELDANARPEQMRANSLLAQLAQDCDVPIIGANNCHYLAREEAYAHEVLSCMGLGRTFDDPSRPRRNTDELFLKAPAEMEGYFASNYPAAFANACEVAARCNVSLKLGAPELPDFDLPPDATEDLPGYLRRVVHEGLGARLAELRAIGLKCDEETYRARANFELDTIISMKFPGYFLIVWDFIRQAKSENIAVGPGRGSGAGSLVAYALRITDLDPLRYNLLFERFLNPDRVSMPDFDIDFCMDRREEVIRYVTKRYGSSKVGQIATFHSLKARGLVRDVCRVMGVSVAESNELAKMIPEGPKVALSLCMADAQAMRAQIKENPELEAKLGDALEIADLATKLRERANEDEKVAKILDVGVKLEGLYRHAGMHAAGVVIGNRDLWEHVPCFAADDKIVTQYTMTDVEQAGLVKFDFLGLKTLTVIQVAVRLVNQILANEGEGKSLVIETIPMDEAGVYEMISRGDTTGVFQLESSGFKELLKKLKPDCFEDIIAAVALYRPGPLEGGMVDQFIDCKHGRREITYPHPKLAEILRETYGVFVYQEQVMQAGQVLAGFSLGAADLMRRAMGKKKKSEMDHQRSLFVEGCKTFSEIEPELANEIFDLIDKFAGYGFNKSHSAAYGLITYQTAFLKHFYPAAFMAALMTCDKDKSENVVKFVAEAKTMGLTVLGPCVNESDSDFSVVVRPDRSQAIRFGLGAVRNVGEGAVQTILTSRQSEGPFTSLFDLCRRVDLKRLNKRAIENLVTSGAADAIAQGRHRSVLVAVIEKAVEQGQSSARDRRSGQGGLFDAVESAVSLSDDSYPDVEPWPPKQTLLAEREVLGFYVTGHPLDRYQSDLDAHTTCRSGFLSAEQANQMAILGGVACEIRSIVTKAGKPMCFFQLEDQFGRIECVLFPKTYARPHGDSGPPLGEWISTLGDEPILVTGRLEIELDDEGEPSRSKILVEDIRSLREVRAARTKCLTIDVSVEDLNDHRILALKEIVANHRGNVAMEMRVRSSNVFATELVFGDSFQVNTEDGLIDDLERLFEKPVAKFVALPRDPLPTGEPRRRFPPRDANRAASQN
jgi:DNA polymerase-3 subunit alpha